MSTRLENTTGNSSKFWEISVSGSSTTVRYGKIGANGTTQTKDHGTAAKAKKFAETQIAKKQKGGYVAVDDNKRARDSESEESSSNSASASSEEAQARKKSKGAEAVIPVKWVVSCGSADDGSSGALGIYVDNKFAFAGNEEGAVIKTNHQGKILAKFQLPSGVKAIVGDGEFLYAGTNEGSLFDLTNGVPREMCKIEGFTEFLWIDVYDGMVGCADDSGNLALINGEGEIVWQKSDQIWGSGWCVRMDASGVYHGHNAGVHKYDYKGKQLWFNDTVKGVMFGVHTDKHLFVTGYGSGDGSCQIDKKSGKTVRTFAASGSSCAVDAKGTLFVVEEQGFDVKTGKRVWSFDDAECDADSLDGNDILRSPSAAILGTKLFTIGGHEDCLALIDVSKRTITQALAGKTTKAKFIKPDKSVKTVQVSNDVATTADESKGIKVKCVKEGSKIRVRVVTAGYKSDWNVQFPRALRKVGAEFMVDSIVTSTNGGFYRAVGDIKKLK